MMKRDRSVAVTRNCIAMRVDLSESGFEFLRCRKQTVNMCDVSLTALWVSKLMTRAERKAASATGVGGQLRHASSDKQSKSLAKVHHV